MLKGISRFALSVTLLLYVTVNPQAHSPDLVPAYDHVRQHGSGTVLGAHEKSDELSSLSTLRKPDFRPAPVRPVKGGETNLRFPFRSYLVASNLTKPENPSAHRLRSSKSGRLSKRVVTPARNTRGFVSTNSQKRFEAFTSGYYQHTGRHLQITSGYRTPYRQARAIHRNLRAYGTSYVLATYRRRAAIREIIAAYNRSRRKSQRAIRMMTTVIEAQVRRGIYVSDHMRGLAFDVRSKGRGGARLSALRVIARSMGARVLVERNHYHVELG